jgi:hypothetical protein
MYLHAGRYLCQDSANCAHVEVVTTLANLDKSANYDAEQRMIERATIAQVACKRVTRDLVPSLTVQAQGGAPNANYSHLLSHD